MFRKKKLLLVHTHLSVGGSQYMAYVLIKGLRSYFDVTLLSRKGAEREHYYSKIKALDVEILCCLDYDSPPGIPPQGFAGADFVSKSAPFIRRLISLFRRRRDRKLPEEPGFDHEGLPTRWKEVDENLVGRWNHFFHRWDKIAIVQIENYYYLDSILPQTKWINLFIASIGAQYSHKIYNGFRYDRPVSFFTWFGCEHELAELSLSKYEVSCSDLPYDYPLPPLDAAPSAPSDCYHLAIFTRLSPEKPIADLLRVFKEIRNRRPVVLHLFGEGDISQYDEPTQALLNQEGILFEGQSRSLVDSCIEKSIDLVLAPCFCTTGGYADIELRGMGIPVVFWNFGVIPGQELYQMSDGAILAFDKIGVFTDQIIKLLDTDGALPALSERQIEDTRNRHDFRNNIQRIAKQIR